MARDLPAKLRLTMLVLGCSGRKDLCGRFRAINPRTQFDLDRAHKWMQGRAEPRSAAVYADWARVLGTARTGHWLSECSPEDFVVELRAVFGPRADALAHEIDASVLAAGTHHDPAEEGAAEFDLAGHYPCYSHAWSPHYRGQIIRGALTITACRGRHRHAGYTERLLGRPIAFAGELHEAGRTLHLVLHGPAGVSPLFISLLAPGPPASVLCGIMSGATAVGPEPLPSATRIVIVRVPGDAAPSNRYFPPDHGAFAEDLAALGLARLDARVVEASMRAALAGADAVPGLDQVPLERRTALAMALDPAWLESPGPGRRAIAEAGSSSNARTDGTGGGSIGSG